MSKRPSFSSALQKLDALRASRPAEERKSPVEPFVEAIAPEGLTDSRSTSLGQSLLRVDSVVKEQSSIATVSNSHSVQSELSPAQTLSKNDAYQEINVESVKNGPCSERTECGPDPVQAGHSKKRTVSTLDPVPTIPSGTRSTPKSTGFTAVTHDLLRGEAKFQDPIDFMIYMHLFSYSHGFGRQTADMSQSQLERFTGATKNTVKRSLERLLKDGWIKMVEDFECARMSRKWRIYTPEDRSGPRPGRRAEKEGVKVDSVQATQSQREISTLLGMDTPTVSKVDTYKERVPKEKSNSLSPRNSELRAYFEMLKPAAKKESELRAYLNLVQDFGEEQIAACLARLVTRGLPSTGAPCHSPMGFLAKAMEQVWRDVQKEKAKCTGAELADRRKQQLTEMQVANDQAADEDANRREEAFVAAFPSYESQLDVVSRYVDRFPMLGRDGPVMRRLAVGAWWEEEGRGKEAC